MEVWDRIAKKGGPVHGDGCSNVDKSSKHLRLDFDEIFGPTTQSTVTPSEYHL